MRALTYLITLTLSLIFVGAVYAQTATINGKAVTLEDDTVIITKQCPTDDIKCLLLSSDIDFILVERGAQVSVTIFSDADVTFACGVVKDTPLFLNTVEVECNK